jgi:hypothetical protein
LLHAAYDTMIASLKIERDAALPKILDYLQRALKLAEHAKPGTTAE